MKTFVMKLWNHFIKCYNNILVFSIDTSVLLVSSMLN